MKSPKRREIISLVFACLLLLLLLLLFLLLILLLLLLLIITAMVAAVSLSRYRKPKVKWTNQMNNDVLEGKRRAQELVASDSAPLNRNGRKKGCIEVLKQLWEEKGYGHLALKFT